MIELSTKGTFTTLAELLTGKVYIGTVPRVDVQDPFQDAVPCWRLTPMVKMPDCLAGRKVLTALRRDVWEASGFHKATIHGEHTGWNKK